MAIISHLMGGLGNQMFQYAVGRSMSIRSGEAPALRHYFEDGYNIAKRQYRLDAFHVKSTIASPSELRSIGPERKLRRRIKLLLKLPIERTVVREKETFKYNPGIFEYKDNVYLIGFWQSYRYFEGVRSDILADFSLKNISPPMQAALDIIKRSSSSVSFHIRRTDYLNPASGFSVLPESYYRDALDLLKKKIGSLDIFAFTDDVQWAEQNLRSIVGNSSLTIVSNPALKDYEEMTLMKSCHHHVIANSSFSWWGAWLNDHPNKTVVAPLNWIAGSTRDSLGDLIPPDWILI